MAECAQTKHLRLQYPQDSHRCRAGDRRQEGLPGRRGRVVACAFAAKESAGRYLRVFMSSAAAVSSRAAAGQCSVADQGLRALLVVLQVVRTVRLAALTAGLMGHSVAHRALPVDLHASDEPAV
ncbi:hypothetical protein NL676_020250 [Syzygium grande]|nr:hypothetical protein NL676_020250 [Syzygium grande]